MLPARTCASESAAGVDHHVDLPGDQVLHRRGAAAIGHELKSRARLLLEEEAGDMCMGCPTPAVPCDALSGLALAKRSIPSSPSPA